MSDIDWGGVSASKEEREKQAAGGSGGGAFFAYPTGTVFLATLERAEPKPADQYGGPRIKLMFRVVECESAAGHVFFGTIDPMRREGDGTLGERAQQHRTKMAALFEIAGFIKKFGEISKEKRMPTDAELAELIGQKYKVSVWGFSDPKAGTVEENYLNGVLYNGTITPNPRKQAVNPAQRKDRAPSGGFSGGGGGGFASPFDDGDIPF